MNHDNIMDNIINKKYEPNVAYPNDLRLEENYIFDYTKSEIWNRDKVQEHNDSIDALLQIFDMSVIEAAERFNSDCILYISEELKISKEAAKPIYNLTYISSNRMNADSYECILEQLAECINAFRETLEIILKDKFNQSIDKFIDMFDEYE